MDEIVTEEPESSSDESNYWNKVAPSEYSKRLRVFAGRGGKGSKVGQIIEDEANEVVVVQSATYWKLLNQAGGMSVLVIANLFQICFVVVTIYMNFVA